MEIVAFSPSTGFPTLGKGAGYVGGLPFLNPWDQVIYVDCLVLP